MIPFQMALVDCDERSVQESKRRLGTSVLSIRSEQLHEPGILSNVAAFVFANPLRECFWIPQLLERKKLVCIDSYCLRSSEWIDRYLEMAHDSGALLFLGNPIAALPSRATLLAEFQKNKIGSLGLVKLHRWESGPALFLDQRQLPESLWKEIHYFNLLFTSPPQTVFALPYRDRQGITLHISYPSEGMAIIDYFGNLPQGDSYVTCSMIGSTGATYADDHFNVQLLYRGGDPQALRVSEANDSFSLMIGQFDAICRNLDKVDAKEGSIARSIAAHRATIAIEKALFISLDTQKPEAVQVEVAMR